VVGAKQERRGVWLVAVAVALVACAAPAATPPPAAAPAPQLQGAPGQAAPAEPAAPQPPLRPLRVAYTALVSAQAPLWIALETGLFREQGLDVEATLISGSDKAIAALLTGETPITMLASGAMVSAVSKGADLVYLASTSSKLTFQLITQPQITSVEQLRGQPVGATGRGSQSDFALRYALRRLGLDPEQDIVFRAMAGGEPQMVAALESGAIAAAALNPPNDLVAEQAGLRSLARMSDWNVPSLGVGVAVRRGYLAEQRDTARRFVRAFALGAERMKADPALAQAVIRQYLQSDDGPAIEWGYRVAVESMPAVPYPTEAGLQSVIDALAEVDPDVATVQPSAIVDRSILDEIVAAGTR
jgi:NitT/TauT family transport system substrate-binding protein